MPQPEKIKQLKIAIIVHGRFEVFGRAKGLLDRGHEVTLLTNYPEWAVRKFDLLPSRLYSFWLHGILQRICGKICSVFRMPYPERIFNKWFAVWASKNISKKKYDVIMCMSGIALETFSQDCEGALKVLFRFSAHIEKQYELLRDEEIRTVCKIDKPSGWIIRRESEEYSLADKVLLLSDFCKRSFLEKGFPVKKIWLNPSASPKSRFKVDLKKLSIKMQKIQSEEGKLRVLFVGNVSFQKGMHDIKRIASTLYDEQVVFYLAGPVIRECNGYFKGMRNVRLLGKIPEVKLRLVYEKCDIFLFPTIQDGFARVLAQAYLQCLPIMATTNCAAPELVKEGLSGWVLPIRKPDLFVKLIRDCIADRDMIIRMMEYMRDEQISQRSWTDAAIQLEEDYYRYRKGGE